MSEKSIDLNHSIWTPRAEITVFWTLNSKPVPAGIDTLDDGKAIWACTVLEPGAETALRAEHAPQVKPGCGFSHGWTPILPPPKRWSPERKAKARRDRLRNRVAKKWPLFADQFEAQEIESRPAYFDAEAIAEGRDFKRAVIQPAVTRGIPATVSRYAAPVQIDADQAGFDFAAPAVYDRSQVIPHTSALRATRREKLYRQAMAKGPVPWAPPAMTVAEHCRNLSRQGGEVVYPEDLGLAPFDLAKIPSFLRRAEARQYETL